MKTPSFNFYPNNWLASGRITTMLPEQEGAYIRLLAYQWNSEDQTIPADDDTLAVLSRLGSRWPALKDKVLKCFLPVDGIHNALRNERLFFEYQRIAEAKSKCSEAGKRGMKARWGDKVVITTLKQPYNKTDKVVITGNIEHRTGNIEHTAESREGGIIPTHTQRKEDLKEWTLEDCKKAASAIGMTQEAIESFFHHYASVGWIDAAGRKITRLASALAKWKANQPSHNHKQGEYVSPLSP